MHARVVHIILAEVFFHRETQVDAFFGQFRKIITLLALNAKVLTCLPLSTMIDVFSVTVGCLETGIKDKAIAMVGEAAF